MTNRFNFGGDKATYNWADLPDKEFADKAGCFPKATDTLRNGKFAVEYFWGDAEQEKMDKIKQAEIIDAMGNTPSDDDNRLGFNL